MNRSMTYILVGGASALVGAVVGYFFSKKRMQSVFNKQLEEAIDKELDAIRKINQMHSEKQPEQEEPVELKDDPDGQPFGVVYSSNDPLELPQFVVDTFAMENQYSLAKRAEYEVRWRKLGYSSEDVNTWLQRFDELAAERESPQDDIPEEDLGETYEFESPELMAEEHENRNSPPEVIDFQEYSSLSAYFSFVTFHYYDEDDVLLDDGDMIVDDIERTVGLDALTSFGDLAAEMNDDDNTVYVRNGRMGLAIEIVRIHGSYAEFTGLR